jgi:hypothetical protein
LLRMCFFLAGCREDDPITAVQRGGARAGSADQDIPEPGPVHSSDLFEWRSYGG